MAVTVKRKAKVIPITAIHSPIYDPERDGVTFSLLSTFRDCREKARLYLQGWTGDDTSFALLYGGMTHRMIQNAYQQKVMRVPDKEWVADQLVEMEKLWYRENPRPRERAEQRLHEAMAKMLALMPAYFSYWKEDFDASRTSWVAVERVFRIPWTVTTAAGRPLSTFLRGRRDGLFTVPYGTTKGRPRLLETKTRADINEVDIADTLPLNKQVNLYLMTARTELGKTPAKAVLNLIRKPALRQKQKEDWGQFTKRIEADVKARPAEYFIRMEMAVDDAHIDQSKKDTDALVEDFLRWYAGDTPHYRNDNACIMYRQRCRYLGVCSAGSYVGLVKRDAVFSELEDD